MKWLYYDLVADIIYLIDTLYFRPRMMYLDPHGIYEKRRKMTLLNFVKAGSFKKDAFSLLPIDWIYVIIFGPQFKGNIFQNINQCVTMKQLEATMFFLFLV